MHTYTNLYVHAWNFLISRDAMFIIINVGGNSLAQNITNLCTHKPESHT